MVRVTIDYGNVRERTGTGAYATGLLGALGNGTNHGLEVREAQISRGESFLRPLFRLQYLWRLRELARQGFDGADVVHFMNLYVPESHPAVAYVVTLHDLDAVEHPELYTRRYVMYCRRALRLAAERATYVITDTDAVKAGIQDRYGILHGRVVTAGVGLLPEFTRAADAVQRRVPPVPTLLFVGSLTRKKNIRWLIETVSAGVKSGAIPNLKLVLAGSPSVGFPEIRSAMQTAGDVVEWVQNPGLDRLIHLYRQSSALVLPSLCEGFGIPMLEAMYCDLPVVASRIPTSLEVAKDAAEFFDLDNRDEFYAAVCRAIEDPKADDRRARGARRLQAYSWDTLVPIFVSTYEAAVTRVHGREVRDR